MNYDLTGPNRMLTSVIENQYRMLRQAARSHQSPRSSRVQSGVGTTGELTRAGLASPRPWQNALSNGSSIRVDSGRWLLFASLNFIPDSPLGTPDAFDAALRIVTPSTAREVVIQQCFATPEIYSERFTSTVVVATTEPFAFDLRVEAAFNCNANGSRLLYGTDVVMAIPG